MSLEILHIIAISTTLGASYIISHSSLATYELQVTAILFVIYFVLKRLTNLIRSRYDLLDGVMFTFVVSNIILSTGGTSSPFFFLSYFLIFSLALLLEPILSLFASLSFVALLFVSTPITKDFSELIPLISLPLMTPFAIMLGTEYMKNQQLKKTAHELDTVKKELEKRIQEDDAKMTLIKNVLIQKTSQNTSTEMNNPQKSEKLVKSFGVN